VVQNQIHAGEETKLKKGQASINGIIKINAQRLALKVSAVVVLSAAYIFCFFLTP
jgi:hypothetical protein